MNDDDEGVGEALMLLSKSWRCGSAAEIEDEAINGEDLR